MDRGDKMSVIRTIVRDYKKEGQTVKVNINYLLGVLHGLKDGGHSTVTVCVINDRPLLVDSVILIADIR